MHAAPALRSVYDYSWMNNWTDSVSKLVITSADGLGVKLSPKQPYLPALTNTRMEQAKQESQDTIKELDMRWFWAKGCPKIACLSWLTWATIKEDSSSPKSKRLSTQAILDHLHSVLIAAFSNRSTTLTTGKPQAWAFLLQVILKHVFLWPWVEAPLLSCWWKGKLERQGTNTDDHRIFTLKLYNKMALIFIYSPNFSLSQRAVADLFTSTHTWLENPTRQPYIEAI